MRIINEQDAADFTLLADRILKEIQEEYFSPSGRCCIDTQTAALLTITEGLHDINRAIQALKLQMEYSGGKLRTGFIGMPPRNRFYCE